MPWKILVGAAVGLLLFGCETPEPLELEIDDCVWDVWRGCAGDPDPTPIVLRVAIPTTGHDPTWVGPQVIIGGGDDPASGSPDVRTAMAFNAEAAFSQGRLGLGRHYVLIRDLDSRCRITNGNPQHLTLEEGREERVEFQVSCQRS